MLYNDILGTIGNTPMIRLNRILPEGAADVFVKAESFNPSGSIKDRAAISMIRDAESRGLLKKGYSIVEPASGNAGIGMAMVAAVLGYKAVIVTPDYISAERMSTIKSYGAEVITTPGSEGMAGAVRKAESVVADGNAFMPQQFNSRANVMAHYVGTAREILTDLSDVNAVVACIGTGCTVTGIGMGMRNFSPGVKVIGVEPYEIPLITKSTHGSHEIREIGANFIPDILDMENVDEVITVKSDDATKMAKRLAREEGILAGISSGAAVAAAIGIAERYGTGRKIVAMLADGGERYMSTGMYD